MQTNKASLPVMSVQGKVDHPIMSGNGYRVGYDGYGRIPMATGGIIYNYKIGDSCMGIAGDHIEPGVSLKNPVEKENNALQGSLPVSETKRRSSAAMQRAKRAM